MAYEMDAGTELMYLYHCHPFRVYLGAIDTPKNLALMAHEMNPETELLYCCHSFRAWEPLTPQHFWP